MKPTQLDTQTPERKIYYLEQLRQLFPTCMTETQNQQGQWQQVVDWDALKQLLGDAVADSTDERYQFTWAGKQAARLEANEATDQTLRPVPEGNRYRPNNRSNGRFHSDWCSMIYPRLLVARSLLSEDGVIFISIDDNEVHNLRKIVDEVFGEENFVGELIHQRAKGGGQAKYIVKGHDYILVYAYNISCISLV